MTHKQTLFKNLIYEGKSLAFILGVIFFCYSVCAALIFQKLLLPLVPSLHAGGGLLSNDSVYFDSVATSLAEQIRLFGWSSWHLYPATGASGNVAILGALYAIFGHDPTLIIPVNALVHAIGGVLIFMITRELSDKQAFGIYAGIIAATLFIVFPSALNWYGQIHKDGYAIAGTLLILLTWVKAVRDQYNVRYWGALLLSNFLGVVLVASVRPYGLKLLLIATLGALAIIVVVALMRHQFIRKIKVIFFFFLATITLAGGLKFITTVTTVTTVAPFQMSDIYANWQGNGKWKWQNTPWLSDNIEGYLEIAAKTRAGMIDYGVSQKAKSMIDQDVAPENIVEALMYLPRALQVAAFGPFPSSWLANFSLTRLVATGEMLIYYLCLPGLFLLLLNNRKPAVLVALYFACFFLVIYGFTISNMGSLYRIRYAYLFVIISLGLVGWFSWLEKTGRLKKLLNFLQPPMQIDSFNKSYETVQQPKRKEAINSGLIVMGLTLLSFIGFFIRDILMVQKFGLSAASDSFFIALSIPMFLVTVFCIPLGMAFVPIYLSAKERLKPRDAKALVSNLSFWVMISLLAFCIVLFFSGANFLLLININIAANDMNQLVSLLNIALPILLFSGVVILGNSVLNANGRTIPSTTSQLVVPVAAILSLLLFGSDYGVKAVMYGMVVGQLLNLLIVRHYLSHSDVSLLPKLNLSNNSELTSLLIQYLPLVASALFVATATPVATLLALSLPEGSVSALNLGTKIVLFITGLVGTAISTVMLPYFSALVAKKHLVSARRELSFFVLLATFVSMPICLGLFNWSETIIRLLFEGGTFNGDNTKLVARVMQYAVIQIPFFISNSLLLKFAMATKHVFAICIISLIGLLVNIGVSVLLIKHMGVAGIALGGSISVMFSTAFLVLALLRYWHLSKFDVLVMFLNWLLFVTFLLCLHFQNIPGVCITIFAYTILLASYFSSLKFNQTQGSRF